MPGDVIRGIFSAMSFIVLVVGCVVMGLLGLGMLADTDVPRTYRLLWAGVGLAFLSLLPWLARSVYGP